MQESGFILIYKEVIYSKDGKPKGNCDTDLVLQTTCDTYEKKYDEAIIISSDGDYSGLVNFLKKQLKIRVILSPYEQDKCSILLKRTGVKISYISDQRSILENKRKSPQQRRTL